MRPCPRDESRHAFPMHGQSQYDKKISMAESSRSRQAYKVLLVDDNDDLLELTADLLCAYGFDVITAPSAEDAIEVLRWRNDIDILLSDIVMRGMSGLQLGYKARELLPNLRVILVSGYPNPALEAGHGYLSDFDFLKKPYKIQEIFSLLV